MFAGLVRDLGRVTALDRRGADCRLTLETALPGLQVGDSVSVNGVCVTVVETGPGWFTADLVGATLARTTLGDLAEGQGVNLEPALALGDVVGGHLVTGHVDEVGDVQSVSADGLSRRLRVQAGPEVMRLVVPRGSVAVDGASLTVADCDETAFEVALIPHTLAVTIAGAYAPGTRVNLEADMVGKYVQRLVAPHLAADSQRRN
ncbi:MAG: riboflavin synthase [Candidatus Dormibacteria bacterium]